MGICKNSFRRIFTLKKEVMEDMSNYALHNGDCLEELKDIPDKSVQLILTDLPY